MDFRNLHIALSGEEKHVAPLIELINLEIPDHASFFCFVGADTSVQDREIGPIKGYYHATKDRADIVRLMHAAEHIILHGAWIKFIYQALSCNSVLKTKTTWIPWGGDYYFPSRQDPEKHEFIRTANRVMCNASTTVDYLKKFYNANPSVVRMFPYPVAIYHPRQKNYSANRTTERRIVVGNSATVTNNHREVLQLIHQGKQASSLVLAFLSYGSERYANEVIRFSHKLFGNGFLPIKKFLAESTYREFLDRVDMGVFGHDRQQALGICYMLLQLGKTVYVKKGSPNWVHLTGLGFVVKDTLEFDESTLSSEEVTSNINRSRSLFNRDRFIDRWKDVLEE